MAKLTVSPYSSIRTSRIVTRRKFNVDVVCTDSAEVEKFPMLLVSSLFTENIKVSDGFGDFTKDVSIYEDGDKGEGEDDGTAGAAGGDDIRSVRLAGGCKYCVGFCQIGQKL
jgi:hypothetical protein